MGQLKIRFSEQIDTPASELSNARDILALKKRLLISSREKYFGSQKDTLLKVMHKVEVKKIGNGKPLRKR